MEMTRRQLKTLTRRAYEFGSLQMEKKSKIPAPRRKFSEMSRLGQQCWMDSILFAIKEAELK